MNSAWRSADATTLTDKLARIEFDKHLKFDKRDFATIEFLLRKGRRQLDLYAAPGIKDIRS